MNRKKWIHRNLFIEAFGQLKVIGISAITAMVLLAVIPPVMRCMMGKTDSGLVGKLSYVSGNYQWFVIYLVLVPVLSFICWNFLTKRNACDFYHSLPYTRESIFISRFLAVAAWYTMATVLSCLASVTVYTLIRETVIVDVFSIVKMFAAIWCACHLCAGGIAIACSLTGTVGAAVSVSLLILVAPRLVITLVLRVISDIIPVAVRGNMVPVFDGKYNFVTGILLSELENGVDTVTQMISFGGSYIYTLLLGAVYISIACILFSRRKSEGAGKPVISQKVRFVIHMGIVFAFVAVGAVFNLQQKWNRVDALPRWAEFIVFCLAGALAVLLYEIIVSKKSARVWKVFPAIAGAYVCGAVFTVAMNVWLAYFTGYCPAPEEIAYVNLINEQYEREQEDYFNHKLGEIEITDREVLQILCDALAENREYVSPDKNFNNYLNRSGNVRYLVKFKSGITTKYRYVYISQENQTRLLEGIKGNRQFCDLYTQLPKGEKVLPTMYGVIDGEAGLRKEDEAAIYETLCKEIEQKGFEEAYAMINDLSSARCLFLVEVNEDDQWYTYKVPVSLAMTDTLSYFYNRINERCRSTELYEELKRVLQVCADGESDGKEYSVPTEAEKGQEKRTLTFEISGYDDEHEQYETKIRFVNQLADHEAGRKILKKILAAVEREAPVKLNPELPVVKIKFDIGRQDEWGRTDIKMTEYYVNIPLLD